MLIAFVGSLISGVHALAPAAVQAQSDQQADPANAPGYGRWEVQTPRCDLTIEGSPMGCSGVRLEQTIAGILTVRFVAEGRDPGVTAEELLFVGELEPGQPPMQCNREGRCQPALPTAMAVMTVAASRYDERGLIMALPQTHLARGSCRLDSDRLACEASSRSGSSWSGNARP